MEPISILIKLHLILIFLLILDILLYRFWSKKGGNYNHQKNGRHYQDYNYQNDVYESDYTEYWQTSNDYGNNTEVDYSSSTAASDSYYSDGLDVYRDYDPYL